MNSPNPARLPKLNTRGRNPNMYRLATKTKTGDVIQFGPKMAMRQAQEKQSALAKLSTYPVYVVNTLAE